jgi:NAD-dependent dihydropyrimidine dehydrogenase PreA subunit
MDRVVKEQEPGIFAPFIDRRLCEGGYHHACAAARCPCVRACPHAVLEIHPLTAEDKRLLSLGSRLRAWIHKNRQAYVVKADACTACGRCVRACPNHVIKLRRRSISQRLDAPFAGLPTDPSRTLQVE